MQISDIIEEQYKPFCRYVIESRALPKISDGLKPVQRRSLWCGKKIAKDLTKVAKLAGYAMSLHPHGNTSIEDSIGSMTQDFAGTNNVPFFKGKGSFGERINGPGNGIASARYVAVKLSENFHNIFGIDNDLINMVPNYDETDVEPECFLPLVPTVLLNPIQGIAVGFACNILPRNLDEVKKIQIAYLEGKNVDHKKPVPFYNGFKGTITKGEEVDKWLCGGIFTRLNNTTIQITEIPIGTNREQYVSLLDKLEESEYISEYQDNCTGDFDFTVKLCKPEPDDEVLIGMFKLRTNLNENITLIGFDGTSVLEKVTAVDVIQKFTDWRFGFYLTRFTMLLDQTDDELEFKKSLLMVITKGLFKVFPSQKRSEIVSDLQSHKIKNVHINKILQIPIYRFGKDEVEKLQEEIKALEVEKKEYTILVNSKPKRVERYIKEIKNV
jgi:DNA topoisomerase-2